MDERTENLINECKRQEESCLYTSAAFFEWLNQVRLDFKTLADQVERRRLIESIQPRMGAVADRAAVRLGPPPGSLLQPATAAAAAVVATTSAPAFPNTPREPTKPQGFA